MNCNKCYHRDSCTAEEKEKEKCKKYIEQVDERFIKLSRHACEQCKWSCTVTGVNEIGRGHKLPSVACDYLGKTAKFRIFGDHKMLYDPKLCDKFEAGKRLRPRPFESLAIKRKRVKGGAKV